MNKLRTSIAIYFSNLKQTIFNDLMFYIMHFKLQTLYVEISFFQKW